MLNMEIVNRFGARVARLIDDASPGAELTSSIHFLGIPTSDLRRWRNMGLLSGGENGVPWKFAGIPSENHVREEDLTESPY